MDPIPNLVFVGLYVVAAALLIVFTVQSWRFARKRRRWGAWAVFWSTATYALFVVDLALLRGPLADHHVWYGANGWVTLAVRVVWIVSLGTMIAAARMGAIMHEVFPPGMTPRRRRDDWKA